MEALLECEVFWPWRIVKVDCLPNIQTAKRFLIIAFLTFHVHLRQQQTFRNRFSAHSISSGLACIHVCPPCIFSSNTQASKNTPCWTKCHLNPVFHGFSHVFPPRTSYGSSLPIQVNQEAYVPRYLCVQLHVPKSDCFIRTPMDPVRITSRHRDRHLQ